MGLDWRLVEKVVDGKKVFPVETLGGRLLSRTNPEDVALAEAQLRADKEHGAAICVPKFVRSLRQIEIPGRGREVPIKDGWLSIADETPPYKFVACPRMPSDFESMKVKASSITDLEAKRFLPFAFIDGDRIPYVSEADVAKVSAIVTTVAAAFDEFERAFGGQCPHTIPPGTRFANGFASHTCQPWDFRGEMVLPRENPVLEGRKDLERKFLRRQSPSGMLSLAVDLGAALSAFIRSGKRDPVGETSVVLACLWLRDWAALGHGFEPSA
ncbi:hypothetical protein WV31_10645 [Magnetospirillum sp. ME-1]|nr:hypothetical protein WV31_10645 [Magnetospirillum sp. ME-1]